LTCREYVSEIVRAEEEALKNAVLQCDIQMWGTANITSIVEKDAASQKEGCGLKGQGVHEGREKIGADWRPEHIGG
jgi:hypothetical protein